MEKNEVSLHEVKVYRALRLSVGKWLSSQEISEMIGDVAPRTVRAHVKKLVGLGLLEMAELFPAHRYKWSVQAEKRNTAYVLRLKKADEIFAGPE